MKLNNSKININSEKIFYYLYFLLSVIAIASFLYILKFLYLDIYKIVVDPQSVTTAVRDMKSENININKFNTVIEKIKEKTASKQYDIKLKF